MYSWTIGFLLGAASLLLWTQLPAIAWAWGLLGAGLLGVIVTIFLPHKIVIWLRLPLAFLLGFSWSLLHADLLLAWKLPTTLENQTLIVKGHIASLPEQQDHAVRFEFVVKQLQNDNLKKPIRIRLSWYQTLPHLQVGDEWQLAVRLKSPHEFSNLGSFSEETWLFEHGIRAVGYVQTKEGANQLLTRNSFYSFVDHWREKLAAAVATDLKSYPLRGLISALTVGVRNDVTTEQWDVLRGTGTNHLFAIAGLHIGFVTAIIYAIASFLWRRSKRLSLLFPAPQAAALVALLSAIFYSALAGFSLPTLRAVIMITIFLFAKIFKKNLLALTTYCLALLAVLIIEPLAFLSSSFWLSFGAVALLIYGMGGRFQRQGKVRRWLKMQWLLAFGLLPFGLLFFQQSSLAGFLANTLAIPWVGFIVLPLCLLGILLWMIAPLLSSYIFVLAEHALELIWPLLTMIAHQSGLQWQSYISNKWIFISAMLAVILLLAPRGFPGRYLGVIWGLPLLFWQPNKPSANEAWFNLLDVGRGMSAVIRTPHHVLLYDTGPSFSATFNAGDAIVLPFLRASGIGKVDTMILGETDNNHFGGTASILSQIPVQQIFSTMPAIFKPGIASSCMPEQQWQWDGVNFQILNSTCVLRIDNGTQSILLADNIDRKNSKELLQNPLIHAADIFVGSYHKSNAAPFSSILQIVHPYYLLFSGIRPLQPDTHCSINNLICYYTSNTGTISFNLTGRGAKLTPSLYRKEHRHFWDN